MLKWSAARVAELVTNVLRDVGTDEATIAAVRLEFAREAIDGLALTLLGQQELSLRFGPTGGLALRLLLSLIFHLSALFVNNRSRYWLLWAQQLAMRLSLC